MRNQWEIKNSFVRLFKMKLDLKMVQKNCIFDRNKTAATLKLFNSFLPSY